MLMRAMRSRLVVAVAAVVSVVAARSYGALWGSDGHKIVAQIAYDNLTPKAKAEVDKLLDGDTLPGIANWADDVRNQRPATKPWHFADMETGDDSFELASDCPTEGCAVSAILDFSSKLAGASTPKPQRQEALYFLVHFVGDIHQPLHAGHASDKGGNDIKVKFFGSTKNLHSVWDSGLIQRKGLSWTAYAQQLKGRFNDSEKKQIQDVTDPGQWATESHLLAESHAYVTSTGEEISSGDTLSQSYFTDNITVVEDQLAKGGLRLAATLNAIFDPPATGGTTGGNGGNGGTPPAPDVMFVGSVKSQVYHLPNCKDVETINPDNFVEYKTAPPGKRLHKGCPRK